MYIFAFFTSHQQINGVNGRACGQQFVDEHYDEPTSEKATTKTRDTNKTNN